MSENKLASYALVLVCVIVLVFGQILFKEFSTRLARHETLSGLGIWDYAVFAGAGILYGASSVLWVIALRDIPLSKAYPFMALGFVLVPLGALLFYGEQLSSRYFFGVLLIVGGLVVITSPARLG